MSDEQRAVRIAKRGESIGSIAGHAIPSYIVTTDGMRWLFHRHLDAGVDSIDLGSSVIVYPNLVFVRDASVDVAVTAPPDGAQLSSKGP